MLLNIIYGGLGSGKSNRLYDLISENLKNNPNCNAILIVPEQFSYTAEKTLSAKIGGLGINNVEVVTFSRLVYRFITSENNLLPSGKMMLACSACENISETNIYYRCAQHPGFISSITELFSEFRRYNISPEDFEKSEIENVASSKKINSINEIYKNYVNGFSDDFTDSDYSLTAFSEFIESSDTFSDTFFFIDDYNDFMPQHLNVIRSLIRRSRGVFVTLGMENEDDNGLFAPVLKTKKRLSAIALSENATLYTSQCKKTADYIKADDILHLLNNWEQKETYKKSCENIKIFTARDLYSEVENTASHIISLVRDNGYRYRDIGVICGNIENYLHILNAIFTDYNIPYFTDEKLDITMHPIAKTVLSLFDIISSDWSYNSVFDYLRTGYIYEKNEDVISAISQEEIDLLENYVLLHGIKGKKAWFSKWEDNGGTIFDDVIENRHSDEFDLDILNTLREKIIAPFVHFLDNKGRTADKIASAVYDFLCDINLYEGILLECDTFEGIGMLDEAEQFKQIWNIIMEVLDQIVVTQKGAISRDKFALYFKCGLSACQISIIPSSLDRVQIGTVQRNSPSRVKVLFIIGTSAGAIPPEISQGAILSDADRLFINSALSKQDKELAPDNVNRAALENLKLYRIISTAEEKLFISCPVSDSDGKSITQSRFINDILEMFPGISTYDDVISKPTAHEIFSSPERGFNYLLSAASEIFSRNPDTQLRRAYDIYSKSPTYRKRLALIEKASSYKSIQPKLTRQKAELLYGKNKKYSITALEKYSKCPFAYYLENGMYLTSQEEKRVEKSHIGSLIHLAMRNFCEIVEKNTNSIEEIHKRWEALSSSECNEIIHTVMTMLSEKILNRAKENTKQIEYLLSRCERVLRQSIETIRLSLSKGGYTAVCYEKDFEVKIDWQNSSVTLIGTIDRIDVMEIAKERKVNIRIIDYKSGHKSFSLAAICNKIDMQLVLYSIAAAKLCKSGKLDKTNPMLTPQISAILYNKINDDMVSIDSNDIEKAKSTVKREHRLDGLIVLDDCEDINASCTSISDMDNDFIENGSSEFLRVSLKKDKTISSASQVISRTDFDAMSKYLEKQVIDIDKNIRSGNISVTPYKDKSTSVCTYCKFSEACMVDNSPCNCRRGVSGDYIEIIKKEVDNNE